MLGTGGIDEDTRRRLWAEGFLALPDLFTPAEVDEVARELDGLFDRFDELPRTSVLDLGATAGEFGSDVPEILYPSVLSPALRRTAVFRRGRALARQVLGPGTWFRFDHSIRKPPGCSYETVWHQDRVHKRSGLPERRLNIWIPTGPVTAEDGCMRYVPRSHLGGVLPHEPVPGRRGALRTVGVVEGSAVDVPLPLGGAALHLFETVHSAHPNRGQSTRTAWILQFTQPRTVLPTASLVHRAIHFGQTRAWRKAEGSTS
ncbi:phytanoyl-CoA dioxygenase family protein [Actinokineospora enzanensis]|uniref:phytanoyl-CoA dioxygenase family protein n=1 Tax=Actinokineospora enzanensis TaxID=155975 RepID=UPI0003825ADC|nr:phytanoyl-CoA dioxygenase family protein [Actinokineospora enzanensis]